MMRLTATALTTLVLCACTAPAEVDETALAAETEPTGAAAVTVESISNAPRDGVEDQFVSCVEDKGNGIRQSQFYLIKDGAVKSYSQMQNHARPMCDPGQPGCALGWQGDEVALYFETASGPVNQMLLNLETMTMRKRLTSSTSGVEDWTAQCTSGPLPEGVTID